MSHRRQQLESSLQRAIGDVIIAGLNDPRIEGIISVTSVSVSPDGRAASVGVSVMPEHKQRNTLHGLRHAAGHIHAIVARKLRVRSVPALDFYLDTSLKTQARVLQTIREAVDETEHRAAEPGDSDDGSKPQDHSS